MTSSVRKMTDFLRCPARCATTGRRSRRTRAASQLRCQHGELATWHGATGGRSRPAKAAGTRVPYLLAWRLTSGGMGFTLALGNMRGHEATTLSFTVTNRLSRAFDDTDVQASSGLGLIALVSASR
jgi:hypothetical protein